jgi:hypothetical protein
MNRRLLLVLVFSTAGCRIMLDSDDTSGMTDGGTSAICQEATTHSDLAWIQDNVFTKACAFSGCHKGTASSAGFLNLETGMSHSNLVAQPTQSITGFMRVVAGSDSTSYLMVAIDDPSASGPEPQHGYMPQGNPELCQEKKDAIGRWIMMGAMP